MFARRSVASKNSAIIPNSFHASRGEISWPSPAAFSSFSCVIVSGTDPEKTLLLVDGSSYLYRAYHALPELRSPKTGEPTGAIYGVLNMLRKLATDYKAQARAAVFDAKGRTFRDELYADYKATRTAMPDDLSRQIEPLHEAVKALGWPLLLVKGVEADDVIATLVAQATARGWRTVISTGDKDLTQLVDERTLWINTMSNEKLDVAGVTAKFGVPPDKIVDYLALIGDQIDNIPGVDKVGPKTACKWIVQYGSLEGVMAHADEISGLAGENLRKVKDWLPKARELLTVKRDVPLDVTLDDLVDGKGDPAKQRAQYERFGFKSWQKEVENAPMAEAPELHRQRRRSDERAPRRTRFRIWRRGGLPACRARLRRRSCPARRGWRIAAAQALARARRLPQGHRGREARLAYVRQPGRAPGGLRARHDHRVLRAGGA